MGIHRRACGRRGLALGQAIMLVALLAVMSAALAGLSITSGRLSDRRALGLWALNIAQMGLEEARADFAYNEDFLANGASKTYTFTRTEAGTNALIQCQFVLTRSDKASTDTNGNAVTLRQITSVGTVNPGTRSPVSRTLRISLAGKDGDYGVLNYTLAANHTITLSGSTVVDSIKSFSKIPHKGKLPNASDRTGAGSIFSNEDVILTGSSSVGGEVDAVGTVTGATGRVNGSVKTGQSPKYFPPITQAMKDAALVDGTTTSANDITLSSGTIKGKYNIPAGKSLILTDGLTIPDGHTVWITGNLVLDNGKAYIYGTGNVIVDGTITIDRTSASSMAGNILYMTTSSANPAVNYNGVHIFRGVIYAPNGTIQVTGGPNISTNLIGDYVNFVGTTTGGIYSDISSPVPDNNLPRLLSSWGWEELP